MINQMKISPAPWLELIDEHRLRYPAMTAQDVYKLLYQGIRGPEHLLQDQATFKRMLEQELQGLAPDPAQELYEAIQPAVLDAHPGRQLYRIHLRRWLCSGEPLEELAAACLDAARLPWGSEDVLRSTWEFYYHNLSTEDQKQAAAFHLRLQQEDYPPVHHSEIFREKYKPAYRLVSL